MKHLQDVNKISRKGGNTMDCLGELCPYSEGACIADRPDGFCWADFARKQIAQAMADTVNGIILEEFGYDDSVSNELFDGLLEWAEKFLKCEHSRFFQSEEVEPQTSFVRPVF
jgi:hypothetical protein